MTRNGNPPNCQLAGSFRRIVRIYCSPLLLNCLLLVLPDLLPVLGGLTCSLPVLGCSFLVFFHFSFLCSGVHCSLPLPIIFLIVIMYRHYSPRSRSSDVRPRRFSTSSGGVYHNFPSSRRGGSWDISRQIGSAFDSFSDDRGFHYSPPWHGVSGFNAPWLGGSGFATNLGDGVGFDARLSGHGFDYSPTRHGHGGQDLD